MLRVFRYMYVHVYRQKPECSSSNLPFQSLFQSPVPPLFIFTKPTCNFLLADWFYKTTEILPVKFPHYLLFVGMTGAKKPTNINNPSKTNISAHLYFYTQDKYPSIHPQSRRVRKLGTTKTILIFVEQAQVFLAQSELRRHLYAVSSINLCNCMRQFLFFYLS